MELEQINEILASMSNWCTETSGKNVGSNLGKQGYTFDAGLCGSIPSELTNAIPAENTTDPSSPNREQRESSTNTHKYAPIQIIGNLFTAIQAKTIE